MRYGSGPDALGPLGILLEVKTMAKGSLSPLESLDKVPKHCICQLQMLYPRGGSRVAAASKMECFVIIVNGVQALTITAKHSILDVAAALDPLLLYTDAEFWILYSYSIVPPPRNEKIKFLYYQTQ